MSYDKFRYEPCANCGEMLDEATGDVAVYSEDREKVYCVYCVADALIANKDKSQAAKIN